MKPKNLVFIIIFVMTAAGPHFALAGDSPTLEFSAPTFESPYYLIQGAFEIGKERFLFKSLDINGVKSEHFLVLRDGKPADLAKPLEFGVYDIVIHYAWKAKKPYKVTLLFQFQSEKNPRERKTEWSGTSPEEGGIPDSCEEGFFRVFKVEEGAGLERKAEVVSLTLTAPKSEIEKPNFCFYDGAKPVPYQIIDARESVPPESQAKTHPVTLTYKLALPLDVAPLGKKLLIAVKGEGSASAEKGFALSGEGFGKTVKSSRIALELHPKSGQINTIEFLTEKIKLHNAKAGVIHWNPDVYIPGIAWDHSFDWNPPQSLAEKDGPFVYINARKGPLPHIKDIGLEVKYTLEKEAPYFVVETRMTVDKDLGVIALRNDEMVLYKRLFDTLIYKDKKGGFVKLPLLELPGLPNGLVHIAPVDTEWVGLVNTFNRYGFFSIRIQEASANLDAAGDFSHKAGTYFYAPSDGEYVFWVRPYLYTWAEYTTNNLLTFLPQGSFFYEKNAYILLPMDDKTPAVLDELAKKLKNPLRVF